MPEQAAFAISTNHLMNTYSPLPVAFSHGKGVWIWDTEDKCYLDALAGIAVSGLGHAHPDLVAAISQQAARVLHTSNNYRIPNQIALADQLAQKSHMREAFFCNSGSEANETAIKLARLYGHRQGNPEAQIIVMSQAWHGRTLATLAATGNPKAKVGFEPLPGGFIQVAYNDLDAVVAAGERDARVNAVLLEVLQGEGGIRVADLDYVRGLRALCDARGWLLMIDEVQSGIGRTGKWFAHQWSGIVPDVMTLAKGLGSGVPIGACLAAGRAAGVMGSGNHGSTFGGNPLACSAALTTLEVIERDQLMENALRVGAHLKTRLQAVLTQPGVLEVRGEGLMLGVVLDRPCTEISRLALAHGLLVNVTQERVVRLLPPLILTIEEADTVVERLNATLTQFLN